MSKTAAEVERANATLGDMCAALFKENERLHLRESGLSKALDDLATRAERARDILSVRGEWAMLDTSLARDTLRSVGVRKEAE